MNIVLLLLSACPNPAAVGSTDPPATEITPRADIPTTSVALFSDPLVGSCSGGTDHLCSTDAGCPSPDAGEDDPAQHEDDPGAPPAEAPATPGVNATGHSSDSASDVIFSSWGTDLVLSMDSQSQDWLDPSTHAQRRGPGHGSIHASSSDTGDTGVDTSRRAEAPSANDLLYPNDATDIIISGDGTDILCRIGPTTQDRLDAPVTCTRSAPTRHPARFPLTHDAVALTAPASCAGVVDPRVRGCRTPIAGRVRAAHSCLWTPTLLQYRPAGEVRGTRDRQDRYCRVAVPVPVPPVADRMAGQPTTQLKPTGA